jgi:hypothetical protein
MVHQARSDIPALPERKANVVKKAKALLARRVNVV